MITYEDFEKIEIKIGIVCDQFRTAHNIVVILTIKR